MKNIQNLTIDINKKPFQTITANTGEVASRFVRIRIVDGAMPIDLTGINALLYAEKPDGKKVFNNVSIEDDKNGIMLAELTSQVLAVEGIVKLNLLLEKDNSRLCTKQILLSVDKSLVDDEAIESTNEFTVLIDALDRVNNIDSRFENVNSQLSQIKSDVRVELLDTLICNAAFFKLANNSNYPILQGGCFSDDGLSYYCCSITSRSENEAGIIDKYSVGNVSDFSTWTHAGTSKELNTSHGNDMTYFNNMLYLTNTNANPNEIILINPNTLTIEKTINIKYGATAITYNKKLNQFITRRKEEWSTFDFYDVDFNYIKTSVAEDITFDTVQGIDSDDSYIYCLCSDPSFGNSVVAFDLNGNFVKRLGSNTMSEIEHMSNHNGYFITGYYKNGGNFLAISTLRTDRRMTGSRYLLNQGRNTVLTDSTQIWNGDIPLSFSRKYYSHLSFNITVDGVDVETKILDVTDTQNTTSRILNTFRLTGNGQAIFYRSLLVIRDNTMNITPVVYHAINADGTRVVKTYASEPSAFTKSNSIGISNVCGQILCGQRMSE